MYTKTHAVRELTYGAMIVLLMSVTGGVIRIVAPFLPFTLQPIVAVFAGFLLLPKTAFACQAAYVMLGLFGVPVFTGGGGPGYVLSPTFGYILGFVLCSFVVSLLWKHQPKQKSFSCVLISLTGLLVIYLIGIPYMYFIFRHYMGQADFSLIAAVSGNIIYFAKDLLIILVLSPIIPVLLRRIRAL